MYVCIHVRKRKDSYIIGDDINMKNQYGKQLRFILHLFKHIYLKKTLKNIEKSTTCMGCIQA